MLDVERYYRTLDLSPGASQEDIHQSYKDLVLVWHPDRFASLPRLRQKAQCKLQEINEAHEQLRSLKEKPSPKASQPHPTYTPSPTPPAQSNVQDFYKPGVSKTGRGENKRGFENQKQFTRQSHQKDIYMWLD